MKNKPIEIKFGDIFIHQNRPPEQQFCIYDPCELGPSFYAAGINRQDGVERLTAGGTFSSSEINQIIDNWPLERVIAAAQKGFFRNIPGIEENLKAKAQIPSRILE